MQQMWSFTKIDFGANDTATIAWVCQDIDEDGNEASSQNGTIEVSLSVENYSSMSFDDFKVFVINNISG